MNFYQLRELGASGKEDIITSCFQSEPNALNVVFLIDVFSNLCSYLVLYIHNRLIYVGNCKSRRFVSGCVLFIFQVNKDLYYYCPPARRLALHACTCKPPLQQGAMSTQNSPTRLKNALTWPETQSITSLLQVNTMKPQSQHSKECQ